MGWTFTRNATRHRIIEERTAQKSFGDITDTRLAHKTVGNVLWIVWERTYADGRPTERYIECDLLAPHRGYGWGYKDMEESMGPNYYTCPLSYLDMVPEPPNEWAKEWRKKVRAYHARVNQRLQVGQEIALPGCNVSRLTITSLRPLLGKSDTGMLYRIPRRLLPSLS